MVVNELCLGCEVEKGKVRAKFSKHPRGTDINIMVVGRKSESKHIQASS